MAQRKSKKRYIMHPALLVALFAFVLCSVTFIYQRNRSQHNTIPISAGQDTKGELTNDNKPGANNNADKPRSTDIQPGDEKSNSGGATNGALLQPTGDLVSNHHPNLSGNPAPNSLSSVCTTTPGATCQISFTKGGITKSLASQTTDRGGSAYWNWKLQDLGLDEGEWTIQAEATLNGSSKSTIDSLKLEVTQ